MNDTKHAETGNSVSISPVETLMSQPEPRCPRCAGRLYAADDGDAACLACGNRVYDPTPPLPFLGTHADRPSQRTVRNEVYRGASLSDEERELLREGE